MTLFTGIIVFPWKGDELPTINTLVRLSESGDERIYLSQYASISWIDEPVFAIIGQILQRLADAHDCESEGECAWLTDVALRDPLRNEAIACVRIE